MKEVEFISIPQLAKILGISRIAVYKRVKNGRIKAIKIGRSYAISISQVGKITGDFKGRPLTDEEKARIDKVIQRTFKEYGNALKQLGDE